MIRYFVINNESRASKYGVGTYLGQLEKCIKCASSVYLSYIDIHTDVKEYTMVTDEEGFVHYKIPSKRGFINDKIFYRNMVYFLIQNIPTEGKILFHLNFFHQEFLVIYLKFYFIDCRIMFTIHYWDWCFLLNGNVTRFKNIINGNGEKEEESVIDKNVRNNFILDRSFLRKCDEIIVLSQFAFSLLIEEYKISKEKLHLIYNGLSNELSFECKKEIHLYDRYIDESQSTIFLENYFKNILYVGRLDSIKGVSFLIKAFRKLAENNTSIRLILVGDGDFKEYLSLCDGIWDRVVFTGKVSKERLHRIYMNATIGVQPSFHEQCSYSAIEMMKYGIPLIVSDSTGLKEMMDDVPNNILHIDEKYFSEGAYIEQLYKKMEKLITNESYRLFISKKMIDIYQKKYTIDIMSNSLMELIKKTYDRNHSYFVSDEFLVDIDNRMIKMIDNRPDMDVDFYGIGGVGCYLWWRIENLNQIKSDFGKYKSLLLQEYFIYYIDWLAVFFNDKSSILPMDVKTNEIYVMLSKLYNAQFYKTKVLSILKRMNNDKLQNKMVVDLSEKRIVSNALRIYNSNF